MAEMVYDFLVRSLAKKRLVCMDAAARQQAALRLRNVLLDVLVQLSGCLFRCCCGCDD